MVGMCAQCADERTSSIDVAVEAGVGRVMLEVDDAMCDDHPVGSLRVPRDRRHRPLRLFRISVCVRVPAHTAGQMSFNQLVNDNIIGVQRQLLTSKYNTKYRQRYINQEIAYT